MSLIVAKLGSSTLVDESGELRERVMDARVADFARLRREGHRVVVVSSGAIALGFGRLGMLGRPTALPDLQAASAVGQGALIQRYDRAFAAHEVIPAQVLLTSADVERRDAYVNARTTLRRLLALGTVPVVNENDTTSVEELAFGDNDVLAAQVAILLGADCLVLLTDREGLYGPGPEGPELIGEVPADVSPEDVPLADMRTSGLGRGGVESKIAAAGMATRAGVSAVVASGRDDNVIGRVVAGEAVGTRFAARRTGDSAFKLWLRYAKPAMGSVRIDAGAARALQGRGTSLLPVGVVGCSGGFAAGDAVEITDADGTVTFGKGIVQLSADELGQVLGLKTEEVRRRLPGAAPTVVHRDQLVLFSEPPAS